MGACHNAPGAWCDNPECVTNGCQQEQRTSKQMLFASIVQPTDHSMSVLKITFTRGLSVDEMNTLHRKLNEMLLRSAPEPLPASKGPEIGTLGDWACPSCKQIHFGAHIMKCICGYERPAAPSELPVTSSACGALWMHHERCLRCGAREYEQCKGTFQQPPTSRDELLTIPDFLRNPEAVAAERAAQSPSVDYRSFQQRALTWMRACFQRPDSLHHHQRSFRFLEEAIELGQSAGTSKDDVLRLVDYVYSRHPGAIAQEIGGVMVTLAGLASSAGQDVVQCAEAELQRCIENTEKIRAKDLAKPERSPLPGKSEAQP